MTCATIPGKQTTACTLGVASLPQQTGDFGEILSGFELHLVASKHGSIGFFENRNKTLRFWHAWDSDGMAADVKRSIPVCPCASESQRGGHTSTNSKCFSATIPGVPATIAPRISRRADRDQQGSVRMANRSTILPAVCRYSQIRVRCCAVPNRWSHWHEAGFENDTNACSRVQ